MKLSEIAEYIADNYPESNIAYNNDVIKGCREEWYEESCIDPLLDFYMHEELGLCGCGNPESTYETIRRYLNIRNEFVISKIDYQEVIDRYKNDLLLDYNNDIQYGLLQFMMYILDDKDFTTHGSSIGGCWLTKKGQRLLTVLEAWRAREDATLVSGRYVVDAKSIMGIFSLALNQPIDFTYEGELAADLAKEVQVYESQEV